jgi:hypothetical protein
VFVAVFVGLGFWWGLPLTSAILLVALLAGNAVSAGIALVLGAWSFVVARSRPSPASLHPHLGHAAR